MMKIVSKAGVVLASAVGVAFAVTGCASQQSGAATPANLATGNNCTAYAQPAPVCKGFSTCKTVHKKRVVNQAGAVQTTTTTTTQ
jgi:hypothetical protein